MKIGFVCTNYNNSSITHAAVASLYSGRCAKDLRIVVVDNRSSDEDRTSLESMKREYPEVELVLNKENVGYFSGLNVGICHLQARFPEVKHMVVGNNDLVFPDTFVETLQRHGNIFEKWAVISPDLVTPDGLHQNPLAVHPISAIRKLVWDIHYLSYANAVIISRMAKLTRRFTVRPEKAPNSELFKIPGPIKLGYGACYILGPIFFLHFKKLCAATFMMSEEFFLSEQLRRIGQMPYYDPRFIVTHYDHTSMGQIPGRRQWQIARDAHRIYKYYLSMSTDERAHFVAAASGD
jgi:GT2 family glycosyltransferase